MGGEWGYVGPTIGEDALCSKIATIRQERKQIKRELDQDEQRLDTGRAIFHRRLSYWTTPQALYRRGNETVETSLNRAFFTKLYVDGRRVTEHELREPFDILNQVYQLYREHRQARTQPPPSQRRTDAQCRRTWAVRRHWRGVFPDRLS